MMRCQLSAVVLVVVVGGLAGCSHTTSAPPVVASTPPASSVRVPPMDAGLPTSSPPSPTWDAAAAQGAGDTAFGAMQAFVHTQVGGRPVDATVWFAELARFLSLSAQRSYYGTDPALVPAHTVLGVYPRPASSPYLAVVDAGTDVGTYEVLLSRTGAGQPWMVERLDPPAGVR